MVLSIAILQKPRVSVKTLVTQHEWVVGYTFQDAMWLGNWSTWGCLSTVVKSTWVKIL
jgi:hypothetical protein